MTEFIPSVGPGIFRGLDGEVHYVSSEGLELSLEGMCACEPKWAAQFIEGLQKQTDSHLDRISELVDKSNAQLRRISELTDKLAGKVAKEEEPVA